MARFRAPRDVPLPQDMGLSEDQRSRLEAWLRSALTDIASDLAQQARRDVSTQLDQISIDVPAGAIRRVSPPKAGMAVRLEAPSAANVGETVRLMIETPVGALTVVSAPGVTDDGKVIQPTINGQRRATFTAAGLVELISNGISDWKSAAQFAAESAASQAIATGQGVLDAEYILGSSDTRLPLSRVASDSTEIDIDRTSPGLISWFLKTASVAFSKLANLTGLSVLGRAANSAGVMAAITATVARQVLRYNDAGTALEWEFPVGIGNDGAGWLFDGIDDLIDAGAVLNFERTQSFSLSAWFQTTSTGSMRLISNETADATFRGYALRVHTSGTLGFQLANNANLSSNVILINSVSSGFNDNSLHHFVVTYDGSSDASGVTFYLDGSPVSTTTVVNTLTDTTVGTGQFRAGATLSGAAFFSGLLQHAAIWNSELSATHVSEIYNSGTPGVNLNALATAPAPELWWRIDGSDATGTDGVVDASGNGLHGTAQGGLGASGSAEQAHSIEFGDGLDSSVVLGQATVSVDISDVIDAVTITDDGSNNAQRAALTGDITAAAGSNTTAIAPNVIVNADVNSSAAIAQTKLGAFTGFAAKALGASTTSSAEPIITYAASSNMSAERVATTSDTIAVDLGTANQARWNYIGSASEITNATATGNLGTIDISSLRCGGVYRVTNASSAFTIEGWSGNNTAGFWFVFSYELEFSYLCTLAHQAASTASNGMRVSNQRDLTGRTLTSILFYTGSRWAVIGDDPTTVGFGVSLVTAVSGGLSIESSNNLTITAGLDIDVTASGNYTLTANDIFLIHDAGDHVYINADDNSGGVLAFRGTASGATPSTLVSGGDVALYATNPTASGKPVHFLMLDEGENPHELAVQDYLDLGSVSGNLGTVDISSLLCGGTLHMTPTAATQIEGFSGNNTDGFFFFVASSGTQTLQYLSEDGTASAADRMRLQNNADSTAESFANAVIFYANGRWRPIIRT